MAKKNDEFDFEKSYQDLMNQAKDSGLWNDMVFQTLMKEFKRLKNVCDLLYKQVDSLGVSYTEVGSMGQTTLKSNPATKEYVTAHKTLVNTCSALKEMLAKVGNSDNDWL